MAVSHHLELRYQKSLKSLYSPSNFLLAAVMLRESRHGDSFNPSSDVSGSHLPQSLRRAYMISITRKSGDELKRAGGNTRRT